MTTELIIRDAKVTVSVEKVESGYQVRSSLVSDKQNGILYGKTYKSLKRATKEAQKWAEYQQKERI